MSRKSEEFTKEGGSPHALYPDVSIQKANNDIYEDGTIDPVYQAKARLLNSAIQEIGMGRYQARRVLITECAISYNTLTVVSLCCRWLWLVRVRTVQFKVPTSY